MGKLQELREIKELFEASFAAFRLAYNNHLDAIDDKNLIVRAEHAAKSVEDTMQMYRGILSSIKITQFQQD